MGPDRFIEDFAPCAGDSNAVNDCVVNDTRENRTGVFVISAKFFRPISDHFSPAFCLPSPRTCSLC
jgi:hypothetical protein